MGLKLNMLKLPVRDVARAARHYAEVVGLKQEFVAEQYGWAQFSIGELGLGLYEPGKGGGDREPGGTADFHLSVEDLEAWLAGYTERGGCSGTGLQSSDDGMKRVEIEDPDGNLIKIVQPT